MRKSGIKIAKLFDIEIWLNYSWFVLFFLIAASFTFSILPTLYPDMAFVQRIVIGLTGTLLFFGSVLTHELSHGIYAKRHGMEINQISLFIFGGVAEIKQDAKRPRHEFFMAAIGPATSLALSILFGAVLAIGLTIEYIPFIALGSSLSAINFMLAVFNLLPGFPLDGGRILRAVVWHFTENLEKATRIAAIGGKVIAYLLIAYGLYSVIFAGQFGGVWLLLIGLFLSGSASASYEQTMARVLLRDTQVSDLMSNDHLSVPADVQYKDLLHNYVQKYDQTVLPVESSDGSYEGVVDMAQLPETSLNVPVMKLAVPDDRVIRPEANAMEGLTMLMSTGLNSIPVVKNNKIIGSLSLNTVRAHIAQKKSSK